MNKKVPGSGFKKAYDKEKKPGIFDKAFVDPDKQKNTPVKEGETVSFSKSLDDVDNPKYYSKINKPVYEKPGKGAKDTRKKDFDTNKEQKRFKRDAPGSEPKRKNDHLRKVKSSTGREAPAKERGVVARDRKTEQFKDRFTSYKAQSKAYASDAKYDKKKFDANDRDLEKQLKADHNPEAKMPLNKYISRSGICSRREAVDIIKDGRVTVNKEVVKEPGYKVQEKDIVRLDKKKINIQQEYIYILLNKQKGYITTLDDPKGRKTVADIFRDEIPERIFPVGRLDRNTTGLLLLTNDGDLTQQLAHPKYEIKKIYQVKLDKPVTEEHLQQILNGLELEDGIAQVDKISYLEYMDEIGIEIHSGKNRIVRRIFESLGYVVEKLDRVLYAGLTKKNLPKGSWRHLTRQEVINLKHLGVKKKAGNGNEEA